jgi:hypothetical protein
VIDADGHDVIHAERNLVVSSDLYDAALADYDLIETFAILKRY